MYDNGVTCIFKQGNRISILDKNIVMANLHYVGMLKEIIIVPYINQCVTLMKCSWIPVHMYGNATTVRQDEHGFLGSEPQAMGKCKLKTLCALNNGLTSMVQP
jgi:hypothetical protein